MIDLDERELGIDEVLRASGPRLRSTMSQLPVAEFRRRRRSHRRGLVIAIASVVVLVVGLVAIGTNRNDKSIGNDPRAFHWLLTDLPSGLDFVSMIEIGTRTGSVAATARINVYATDEAPLGPILSVSGSGTSLDEEIVPAADGTNFQETTIGGRRAAFADGQSGQRILYIEIDGRWAALRSRNIDDNTLTTLAQAVVHTTDGYAAVPTRALVDGLALVVTADSPVDDLFVGSNFAGVDYADATGRSISLRVYRPRASANAMLGLEVPLMAARIGELRGVDGHYVIDSLDVRVVSWERDGLAFRVVGLDVTEADVAAAAASVQQASDATWSEMLKQRGTNQSSGGAVSETVPAMQVPPDTIPPFSGNVHDVEIEVSVTDPSSNDQIWSGTLPSGETWTVHVRRVFDSIWFETSVDGQAQGSSSGPLARPAGQSLACCNPASALTDNPDAVALRLTRSNGDRYTIPLHELSESDGLRLATIGIPVNDASQNLELIDAAGNILETLG